MGIESPETDAMMLGSNCHHQVANSCPRVQHTKVLSRVLYHLASVTRFDQI